MDYLERHTEALIFCNPTPLKAIEIQACMSEMFNTEIAIEDIQKAIDGLIKKYQSEEYAIEIN
jgi:segregation and condensation protein B